MNVPNKAVAAVVAGAVVTIVCYGLSFAHITPPTEVAGALQTLITAGIVYLTPHEGA